MSEKKYQLAKDYVTPKFTFLKGTPVAYGGGKYVVGVETFTEQEMNEKSDWFEPVDTVPERIEVNNLWVDEVTFGVNPVKPTYHFDLKNSFAPQHKFPAIKKAIEDAINGKEENNEELIGLLRDAVSSTWGNPSLDKTQVLFDKFLHDRKLAKPTQGLVNSFLTDAVNRNIYDKKYSQIEVDTIRSQTWEAARKWSGKRLPFGIVFHYNEISDYLSSLNNSAEEQYPKVDFFVRAGKGEAFTAPASLANHPMCKDSNSSSEPSNEIEGYAKVMWSEKGYLAVRYKGEPYETIKQQPEQPSNDNAFWTDELVLEFCNAHRNSTEIIARHYLKQDSITDFKKVKEQPLSPSIPDWEIVSYLYDDRIFTKDSDGKYTNRREGYQYATYLTRYEVGKTIHSVRRIKDNILFSVKDIDAAWGEITGFKLDGNYLFGICNDGKEKPIHVSIYDLQHAQPLPTDTDKPVENIKVENIKCCSICGGKLVMVRGRFPNDDKREVCATCAIERLEQINEISGKDYGKACQAI